MNQNTCPLLQKLIAFQSEHSISFHVPGHKNGKQWLHTKTNQVFQKFLAFDVTELSGLDDFHHPSECIREAEQLLTDLYGSGESHFLVNGSTVGNLAAVLSSCKAGEMVLIGRNSHKSMIHALKMTGVKPIFISNRYDSAYGIEDTINIDNWIDAIHTYSNVRAIILTSPSYYGQWISLKKLIHEAHRFGIIVICDEAHGAHFILGEPFGTSAITEGADLVIQSAHKTLPAMTMGSYIHIKDNFPYQEKLKFYLGALQSSSPSYPIMASLDYARYHLSKIKQEGFQNILRSVQKVEKILSEHPKLEVIHSAYKKDPLKIWVRAKNGLSGYMLQKSFEEVGIYTELATEAFVLFIHPLGQFLEEGVFKEKLAKLHVPHSWKEKVSYTMEHIQMKPFLWSYDELDKMDRMVIPFQESAGKISAENIVPYPPGIPIIMDGEQITDEKIETLNHLLKINVTIEAKQYFKEGMIQVYEEAK